VASPRSAALVAFATVILLLAAVPPAPAKTDSQLLDELNQRWAGARCRIRLDIPLKKGKGSDGWTRSVWIVPREQWQLKSAAFLWVSDRSAFPGGRVTPGTDFVAEGWSLGENEAHGDLGLNLRLVDRPVKARLTLHGQFSQGRGIEHLEKMERWARVDVFRIKSAEEKLVDPVPSATGGSPARPTAPPLAPSAPAGALTGVRLQTLGVSVEPNRIRPGEVIELVVTYLVEGSGSGTTPVIERRTISSGGRVLVTLEAEAERPAGTHRSSQPLTVPADLAPGVYELQVEIETAGSRSEADALFQVVP
jgi:hypothetical protein